MLLLLEEMCGDEEMAVAAVRERAKEIHADMVAATEEIDAALAPWMSTRANSFAPIADVAWTFSHKSSSSLL